MTNFTNISISAKDRENPHLLIILDKFNDDLIFLRLINDAENTLEVAEYIEDKQLLHIINIFLVDAKKDEYNLKDSYYNEFYLKFIDFLFYYIYSAYFKSSITYNEIKLINLKDY